MSSRRGKPSTPAFWCSDVLIAEPRPFAPMRAERSRTNLGAAAISAALHAAAIALLLVRPGPALPPPIPPLEIEMVQQQAQVRGAPPPPSPEAAPVAAAAVAATAPAPPLPAAAQSPPPSKASASAPASPSQQQARAKPAAPEVNLGDAALDIDPLSVTGDNVVPPGPDSRYRNLPPHYPAAAARAGAEGTVHLVARIAPNGLPLSVAIAESSGNIDLDEEARRAVLLWRFRPAREGGRAVPYDYALKIRFALDER